MGKIPSFQNKRTPSLRFGKTSQAADILVIGHRGDPTVHPENSIAGFESALVKGDGFECDVVERQVKGKKYSGVVEFYRSLHYAFSSEPLAPLCELTRDPSLKGAAQQPPATIRKLTAILKRPENRDKKVFMELKRPTKHYLDFLHLDDDHLERNVINWILQNGLQKQVILISFNLPTLGRIKRLTETIAKRGDQRALDIQTGLDTFAEGTENPGFIKGIANMTGVDYILPRYSATSQELVDECEQLGLKVVPWTFTESLKEERADFERLVAIGVDGIITNQPDALREFLATQ